MLITVETIGGEAIVIAPNHVTHLVPNNLGTMVYFVSGEHFIASKPIGELTLDLTKGAS